MFPSCAAIYGVEPTVVERAEELVLLSAQGEDLVTACTKVSEQEEEDLGIAVSDFMQNRLNIFLNVCLR